MTDTFSILTREPDSARAGAELGRAIREAFSGSPADAVIVFSSARHDYAPLLRALSEAAGTDTIVGSSSAGEFTSSSRGEGFVSVMGIRSSDMRFAVAAGTGISDDPVGAARGLAARLGQTPGRHLPYRSALVMTDALAGHTDTVVEELTVATGGTYQFFGGGAGDDGRFRETHVFAGREAVTDAMVALEILSAHPLGVGVSHGWEPASPRMRVTEAEGNRLVSLNGAPAIEAFEAHALETGQRFDRHDPMPFFLHNILGIQADGGHRLRVPLGVDEDGAVLCAAGVPSGGIVQVMRTTEQSAVRAAEVATRAAIRALGGRRARSAIVFDCVATRLRLGKAFDDELQKVVEILGSADFVGCNTYGQIARAEGQFGGFHNCTAVVCVLPE